MYFFVVAFFPLNFSLLHTEMFLYEKQVALQSITLFISLWWTELWRYIIPKLFHVYHTWIEKCIFRTFFKIPSCSFWFFIWYNTCMLLSCSIWALEVSFLVFYSSLPLAYMCCGGVTFSVVNFTIAVMVGDNFFSQYHVYQYVLWSLNCLLPYLCFLCSIRIEKNCGDGCL